MMKTLVILTLALLAGCTPEHHYHYHPNDQDVDETKTTSTGMPDLLESVDQRKEGRHVETPARSPFAPKLHLGPRHRDGTRAVSQPAPVGADREPQPSTSPPRANVTRAQAVEVDQGGSRTYLVAPAGERPKPRWEVRSMVEKCERRPTQWARERCMENGE